MNDHPKSDGFEAFSLDGWLTEPFMRFVSSWRSTRLLQQQHKLVGATLRGVPIGLAVYSYKKPSTDDEPRKSDQGLYCSLDSIFIDTPYRRKGFGQILLRKTVEEAIQRGGTFMGTSFLTNAKEKESLDGLLIHQGWKKKNSNTKIVQFICPRGLLHVFGNIPDRKLPDNVEFFTWKDRTDQDTAMLNALTEEHSINMGLHPDGEESMPLDENLSVGFRVDGVLSGWMILHAYDARTIRYSSLWTKPKLERKGLGIRAVMESLRRHRDIMDKMDRAFFTMNSTNNAMQRVLKRRILGGEEAISELIHYSKALQQIET